MPVSGNITAHFRFAETVAGAVATHLGAWTEVAESGAASYPVNPGTAANLADRVWSGKLSLLASTPQTLDLMALAGPRGTVTLARVRGILVRNLETATGKKVTVGNDGGANTWYAPWSSSAVTEDVPPGSTMLKTNLIDGWAVDATHKDIKLNPGTNAVALEIIIVGTSA